MTSDILQKAEIFVYNYFQENANEKLTYHDYVHTIEVVKNTKKIGMESKLSEEDLEIVLLSAWFHDVGYLTFFENHEKVSAEVARRFLEKNDYPAIKTEKIVRCISATEVPQKPIGILDEILCDADLRGLSKKNFLERNELLRLEEEKKLGKFIDEINWLNSTLSFFRSHSYHTQYAIENFEPKKKKNFVKLQKEIRKLLLRSETDHLKIEKLKLEKEKLREKKASSSKADRGIETMFRNVVRTHVEFSGMADNKAHIMISINTLILTAVMAIIVRKLDANPQLVIPTLILTLVSLTTLVFATIVTRPKVTEGVFTKEDIKNKKANLLFFGNFYKMKLDDFSWGMKEMIKDKEFLYGNMIRDFYYLGQILGRKYKYLNICYSIFIYGMIVSVIAFGVAAFFIITAGSAVDLIN